MIKPNTYPKFPRDCHSLLSKYLTPEVFASLQHKTTKNGFSLQQVINSGVENPDSGVGVYAGDEDSYRVFAELFDPIIAEYHGFASSDSHVSNLNADDLDASNPDPDGLYIISTRIRVGRNLAGYPLGPAISSDQRNEIAQRVSQLLSNLDDSLRGNYYPLSGMDEQVRKRLVADHFLFKAGDRFMQAAGMNRDWPEGRGIYHNGDKTFLVWINEEDQLRIISMQTGGDIKQVFTRLSNALGEIGSKLEFMSNQHLGYISSCPTNLGTAMRASVHIKLPRLAKNMDSLKSITDRHELQIRGIHGEHSDSQDAVFDISNRRRLGITEVDCVRGLYEGIVALIAAERAQ
ncbi:MAG: arginine kinase [Gammaproteobacteria bacterium]|nr:arginine kinase [Gammaproteobacteria bacterium]